jgi:hypothetical protein
MDLWYDPETKRHSEEWKHGHLLHSKKKSTQESLKTKIMLIVRYLRSGPSQICSTGSNS